MSTQEKKKIIGLDARLYGSSGKGLGRYTKEVIDNIINISYENKDNINYVVFLMPENFSEFTIDLPNVRKVQINIRWYSLKEQFLLPFYIWKEKIDLMHFPHFNVPLFVPCKFVVTIHDLILTHFPTMRATKLNPVAYFLKNIAYWLVIKMAIIRSKKIITVSNFTKNDLITSLHAKEDKIIVTYEGVTNLSANKENLFTVKPKEEEVLNQYHISGDYLLYVGNAYPHKNLNILIQAFHELHHSHPGLKLVLVGKIEYFYKKVMAYAQSLNLWQENNINNAVIFTGYVPDEQLEVLYKKAKLYIFPSLYEGFGLPPLEAIFYNCLVLSSDRASLPEILGAGAIYFNPEDKKDLIDKIEMILDDQRLKEEVLREGKKMLQKYSWWDCAHNTLNIYKSCL